MGKETDPTWSKTGLGQHPAVVSYAILNTLLHCSQPLAEKGGRTFTHGHRSSRELHHNMYGPV
jgi:hypothetical protein